MLIINKISQFRHPMDNKLILLKNKAIKIQKIKFCKMLRLIVYKMNNNRKIKKNKKNCSQNKKRIILIKKLLV